jgi:hypothetical protein
VGVLADLDDVPTLVFDEIDAGIGGEAAWRSGDDSRAWPPRVRCSSSRTATDRLLRGPPRSVRKRRRRDRAGARRRRTAGRALAHAGGMEASEHALSTPRLLDEAARVRAEAS